MQYFFIYMTVGVISIIVTPKCHVYNDIILGIISRISIYSRDLLSYLSKFQI